MSETNKAPSRCRTIFVGDPPAEMKKGEASAIAKQVSAFVRSNPRFAAISPWRRRSKA